MSELCSTLLYLIQWPKFSRAKVCLGSFRIQLVAALRVWPGISLLLLKLTKRRLILCSPRRFKFKKSPRWCSCRANQFHHWFSAFLSPTTPNLKMKKQDLINLQSRTSTVFKPWWKTNCFTLASNSYSETSNLTLRSITWEKATIKRSSKYCRKCFKVRLVRRSWLRRRTFLH